MLDFGLDGDTVARLRGEPAPHGIPVIALTELRDRDIERLLDRASPRADV